MSQSSYCQTRIPCEFVLFPVHRLKTAQEELATVMAQLKEKQDMLADIEAKIAKLQASYEHSVSEKERLEANIAETAGRLKRAAKLTTGLADEQIRWAESVKVNTSPCGKGWMLVVYICRFALFNTVLFPSFHRNLRMRYSMLQAMCLWRLPVLPTWERLPAHTESGWVNTPVQRPTNVTYALYSIR